MKSKIVLLFSVVAVLALFAVTAVSSASASGLDNEVYFVPEDSYGPYCENISVLIMVDAVDLTTGAGMDIYFDPDCVNITNVDFTGTPYSTLTGWTHEGNYVHIGVMGPMDPIQAGTHLIANLTLHCENEAAECTSNLAFAETELLDYDGNPLPNVIWHDGTFICVYKPDLVISEKSETIVGDELFNITYTVANIGCADAGPTNTTIQIDTGTPIEVLTPAIAKGESYTNTVGPYNCPCGETLTISVCADNDNDLDESDETNNCEVNIVECPPCKPDLIVTEITVNYDAPSLGGIAIGPEPGPGVHTECNNLSAVIEEENEVDVGFPFNVSFTVDGATLCTVNVPSLTGGTTKTVYCNCSWYPYAGDVFAINVTVDSNKEISESDETNNTKWNNGTAVSNGYKGDGWQGPDRNLINEQCHDQDTINLTYSVGDSEYVSGSTQWTEYTGSWTTSDLPVPACAEIEKAMLYVYYTWDKNDVMPNNVAMEFNDNNIALARHYTDSKGFGSYDYPSGMLIYDVRSHFTVTGPNNAILTKAVAADEVSMRGMLLMVIYKHPCEPERIICIDEGYDMLYAKDSYAVTSEEATTYAPFTRCEPVPVEELSKATLIAVAPSASDGDDMNRLSFNDGLWQGAWSGFAGATELGIAEADVFAYLKQTDNRANFQSHIPAGGDKGDFMDASNAFLILEKPPCPAKYAVYQANVIDPEKHLNELRALRDNKLEDQYVTRYYNYSPALTLVLSRADPDLVKDGAQLLSRYSILVGQHVQGMDVNERITRQDVAEALSFTDRLKREVMKNGDAIGVDRTEAIIDFIDEFEGQVKASEGKTFSEALKSSIYYEGGQL